MKHFLFIKDLFFLYRNADKIILQEDGSILHNEQEICNIFSILLKWHQNIKMLMLINFASDVLKLNGNTLTKYLISRK